MKLYCATYDHYNLHLMNGEWQAQLKPNNNTMHFDNQIKEKLLRILNGRGYITSEMIER